MPQPSWPWHPGHGSLLRTFSDGLDRSLGFLNGDRWIKPPEDRAVDCLRHLPRKSHKHLNFTVADRPKAGLAPANHPSPWGQSRIQGVISTFLQGAFFASSEVINYALQGGGPSFRKYPFFSAAVIVSIAAAYLRRPHKQLQLPRPSSVAERLSRRSLPYAVDERTGRARARSGVASGFPRETHDSAIA